MARRPADPTPHPPSQRHGHRHLRALGAGAALAAVALVLLAGCGDDGPPDPATAGTTAPSEAAVGTATSAGTTPTTASAPTTTPPATEPPTEEQAILAAVDGYWQTIREAGSEPPNPDHPGFEQYMTGGQLAHSRGRVEEKVTLGQAVREPENSVYSHTLSLVSQSEDDATVYDCSIDDLVLYDIRSGMTLNDAVMTNEWTIHVVRVEDRWLVEQTTLDNQWEGAVGCAG